VVNGVAEIAKGIKLGPGMESGTQMGPLVSAEQLQRVAEFLESGVTEGATTLPVVGASATRATSSSPPSSPTPART
jgi:acyl-CoA reductase-like NAD-dependent aldehyde dehydrogenase